MDFFGEVIYEYVNFDIELDFILGEDDNGYGIIVGICLMLLE